MVVVVVVVPAAVVVTVVVVVVVAVVVVVVVVIVQCAGNLEQLFEHDYDCQQSSNLALFGGEDDHAVLDILV